MAGLDEHFKFQNYDLATSLSDAILQGEKYRITILSDILVRLEFSENGRFENRPTELVKYRAYDIPKYIKKEDSEYLTIITSYFKLEYFKNRPFYGSKLNPEQNFKITLNNTDKIWHFGQVEARNFKGNFYSLDNADGTAEYYKGLYSTDGFVSLDDSESLIYSPDGSMGRRSDKRIDTYVFMYRKDFGFCLRDYFLLTGKPVLLPRYALGIWWNKLTNYTTDNIESTVWNFKKNEIPLSIFLLGSDWHIKYPDTYSGFTFNYDLIKNPKELIDNLHKNKVRLGLNIDPTGGISSEELAYQRFKNSINHQAEGLIPFNVFNKNMVGAYFQEFIRPLYNIGVDFFWLDYNNKLDLYTLRALNYYHFNDSNQFENKRGLILSRNGMIAAHKYPVLYSGQTLVSWKNLNLLPELNAMSSNIGLTWWSHDIAGCKEGIEDSELYLRFVQLGTFSPIFRFSSEASHYYKREPWLWDVKTLSVAKEYMRLRHRLIPYLYTEAYKYSKTGLPVIQPIYYKYPEIFDEPIYKNEYYFGTELFISPITSKKELLMNRTVHRLFLPDGIWYDFKTGKKFVGGKRYVSFFKDEDYPVFARQGTIIPLAILDNDDLNNTNPPNKMEIQVFPGKNNNYRLYEDDGVSSLHEKAYFLISEIDYNYQANNFTLIIRPVEGKTGIIPKERKYLIRFRNTRKADAVIVYVNDTEIKDFVSYIDGNDFVVELESVQTDKQISVNCKGKDIEIAAERIINEDIDSIISDLQISTHLKEEIAAVLFSEVDIKQKRIAVRKLKVKGLNSKYIRMFIKLLEYIAEI